MVLAVAGVKLQADSGHPQTRHREPRRGTPMSNCCLSFQASSCRNHSRPSSQGTGQRHPLPGTQHLYAALQAQTPSSSPRTAPAPPPTESKS